MDQEQLERLRYMNQDLLQRLKANQEEFKKRIPIKPQSHSLLLKKAAPKNRQVPDARNGKENQGQFPKNVTSVSMEGEPWVERLDPAKPTISCNESVRETHQQGHSCTDAPGGKVIFVPFAAGEGSTRETCRAVKNGSAPKSSRKPRAPAGHGEAKKHSANLRGVSERDRPKTGVEPGQTRAKGSGRPKVSAQMLQTPKSILLTPGGKESKEKTKKEAGRVTFMSSPEEFTIPADDWSVRPFLGYDWIAGLLDMDSSVSEKPDQYFSELQDFRRVNKEACIYDQRAQSVMSGPLTLDEESAADLASHQCVFCYRLNKRLFTVPIDSESACPICKTPRAKQPPESLVEPAFVRVSIPRSTFLPAYKHKIHRRKSYEPTDNLALPTHCLAGWGHPVQPFSPTLSSLDLRSSLASKSHGCLCRTSKSRVSGGTRTDELLDLSHATEFELANGSGLWDHPKRPGCRTKSN
ncbi:migration and invasion-inhibitory protein isoform X2 [Tiliqua scincoides]|uniref:migration and invasion-inhibitory protein isoform X2 n=1 Tax=Tiliqua scincoides TaxID=71010 RepID=UPI00346326FB